MPEGRLAVAYFAEEYFALVDAGKSVCLVGPPGTGKMEVLKQHLEDKEKKFSVVKCTEGTTMEDIKKKLDEDKEAVPIIDLIDKASKAEQEKVFAFASENTCHITTELPKGELPPAKGNLEVYVFPENAIAVCGFIGTRRLEEARMETSEEDSAAGWLYATSRALDALLPKKKWLDFGLRNTSRVLHAAAALKKETKNSQESIVLTFCQSTWLKFPCDKITKPFLLGLAPAGSRTAVKSRLDGLATVESRVTAGFRATKPSGGLMLIGDLPADDKLALLKGVEGVTTVVDPLGGEDLTEASFDEKAIADALKDKKDTVFVFRSESGDPVFERFNTTLDDNRSFNLTSGEKIPLDPTSTVVLLINDGEKLKPALVSRCSVVLVNKK